MTSLNNDVSIGLQRHQTCPDITTERLLKTGIMQLMPRQIGLCFKALVAFEVILAGFATRVQARTTSPVDRHLHGCSSTHLGLFTDQDFCESQDNDIWMLDPLCFMPDQEADHIKQTLDVNACSSDVDQTVGEIQTCAFSEFRPRTGGEFCVSGRSTFGTNNKGEITCEVKRPNIVLHRQDLQDCNAIVSGQNSGWSEKECSREYLDELRLSAVDPNAIFCSTDDQTQVQVVQDQTSCLAPKNQIPASASVSAQCPNSVSLTETPDKDGEYPDETDLNEIVPCPRPWHQGNFMNVKKVCTFRNRYYVYERSSQKICSIRREDVDHIPKLCPPVAFASIKALQAMPTGVPDCDFPSLHIIQGRVSKGSIIICRVRGGYILYYKLSSRICKLPKKLWPTVKLLSYKPCSHRMLTMGEERLNSENGPRIDGRLLMQCDVDKKYLQTNKKNSLVEYCRLHGDVWGLLYKRTGRVCRLPVHLKPVRNLDVYLPCRATDEPNIDVDVSKMKWCSSFKWHPIGSVNRKNQNVCSYRHDLLVFDSNTVCRVQEIHRPSLHKNFLAYKLCSEQQLNEAIRLNSREQPHANKRVAVCRVDFLGPREISSAKIRRTVAPNVATWVTSSTSYPIAIQEVRFVDTNGNPIRGAVNNSTAVAHLRSLLQTIITIRAQFTVVVLSQDVEGTDFPADLARALRRNVHKFDETGTYTVDPQSIKVNEVDPEVANSSGKVSWTTRQTTFLILSMTLVFSLGLLMSGFISHFLKRHKRKKIPVFKNTFHETP